MLSLILLDYFFLSFLAVLVLKLPVFFFHDFWNYKLSKFKSKLLFWKVLKYLKAQ